MAFLAQDDKLQSEGQGSADLGQGQALNNQASSAPLINSGGSLAGSQVSTAGVGKGGRGSFTNIQAYLEANKGNNSTGEAIASNVGSAFDGEQKKIEDDSASKISEGQAKLESVKGLRTRAGQFDFSDGSDDPAKKAQADEIKQGLAGQYSAPRVAYTIGNEANQYGQQLQNDQGFDALLDQTYNKAAGGQISSGQKALQRQLDLNNDQLTGKRQDLAARYKALEGIASTKAADTNSALSGFETGYQSEIDGTKTDLGNSRTSLETQLRNFNDTYTGKEDAKETQYDRLRRQYAGISDLLGAEMSPFPEDLDMGETAPVDKPSFLDGEYIAPEEYMDGMTGNL